MAVALHLASSYIPALICIGKVLAVGLWSLIVPLGGGPLLGLLLMLDRRYINNDIVFDVNGVAGFAFVSILVIEERHRFGIATPISYGFLVLWAVCSVVHFFIEFRHEALATSLLAAMVSLTKQSKDPLWAIELRLVLFLIPVMAVCYTEASYCLYTVLLRSAVIIFSPLPLSVPLSVALTCNAINKWRKTQPPEPDNEDQLLLEALAKRKGAHNA